MTRSAEETSSRSRGRQSPSPKDRRRRSRSRSREGGHSRERRDIVRDKLSGRIHRSRSRSPHKRHFRYDSPPKETGDRPSIFTKQEDGIASSLTGALAAAHAAAAAVCGTPMNQEHTPVFASICPDSVATKAARELYVGNLPPGVDVNQILEFLNAAMIALKATSMPGNPCVKAWISNDGHYAFVECRTLEEASNGMQLNGLNFMGYCLRIGRPKTYPQEFLEQIPQPTAPALEASYLALGIGGVQAGMQDAYPPTGDSVSGFHNTLNSNSKKAVSSDPREALAAAQLAAKALSCGMTVEALQMTTMDPERLCILGLPAHMTAQKIKQLASTFGVLTYFQLLRKDENDDNGICVVEYLEVESEKQAVEILRQNTPYTVSKASEVLAEGKLEFFIKKVLTECRDQLFTPQIPTRVLMLSNIASREELMEEESYKEIFDDVRIECETFGPIDAMDIPKPHRGFSTEESDQTDVGYAFIRFQSIMIATRARKNLTGRRFGGRIVEGHYFNEELFEKKLFKRPTPNYDDLPAGTVAKYGAKLFEIDISEFKKVVNDEKNENCEKNETQKVKQEVSPMDFSNGVVPEYNDENDICTDISSKEESRTVASLKGEAGA